jgi:hypothetical protein
MRKNVKTNLKRWLCHRWQSNEFFSIAGRTPDYALDQVLYRHIGDRIFYISGIIDNDRYRVSGLVKLYTLEPDPYDEEYKNEIYSKATQSV